jgi:hypothetical protein
MIIPGFLKNKMPALSDEFPKDSVTIGAVRLLEVDRATGKMLGNIESLFHLATDYVRHIAYYLLSRATVPISSIEDGNKCFTGTPIAIDSPSIPIRNFVVHYTGLMGWASISAVNDHRLIKAIEKFLSQIV